MKRKAIVTGGAGFIGSHLTDVLLDREWDVLVVDDLTSGRMDHLAGARRRGAAVHVTDIRAAELSDLFAKFGPELVFHLAAQSKVRPSMDDPIHDAEVNVVGTLNVLAAAHRARARKVCFASSGGAVYGDGARLPVKETAAKRPASPYGISKKIVEDYFRWYHEVHGLEYSLLALANVYGPRQDASLEGGVVAIFAQAMLGGRRPVIFGDGTQTRDFVYVGDVCDAFVRAADAGDGLMMNIGTGTEVSIGALYDTMAELIGYITRADHAAAKPGDVHRSVVDASRAKKELGWSPWTTLREGLAKTIEWYREGTRS
ncbi:MAG: GDP-mannose 4,6-dehydratase [Acidimicrobiia bacterium]|nr:GDP-mannose 4,6-dehydratase [Acidimicrobiia bacterium]